MQVKKSQKIISNDLFNQKIPAKSLQLKKKLSLQNYLCN